MPGYGARYWAERTPQSRRRTYPKLRGDHTADVVVIGGGLTGATAAYVAAAAGLDVMLVEAERLASGSTAASLGAIVPEPDALFRTVDALAGRRVARTAWKEARRSALDLPALLRRAGVRADLDDAAFALVARSPEQAVALRKEQAARKDAGIDAPWLSPRNVAAELGTEAGGAIRVHDASTFDPVRATLGLVAAAEKRGARIFERSPVRRTKFTRKDATVVLGDASIRTAGIVVATGEPGALFAPLRRHVRRQWGYAVVTEPLTAPMRREVGRREAIVGETGEARRWLRWLPDDRALFAGGAGAVPSSRQRGSLLPPRTAELMYELSVRHPVLSGLPARWGWDLPIASTSDGLPWIGAHRNYPFHFFALAFGWHGDGLAAFAARAALRFFTGKSRREDDAFGFMR
jgi:glycine/D-amino acid oxidase-like deaminating enzyme